MPCAGPRVQNLSLLGALNGPTASENGSEHFAGRHYSSRVGSLHIATSVIRIPEESL
jgi:hypothetical protein